MKTPSKWMYVLGAYLFALVLFSGCESFLDFENEPATVRNYEVTGFRELDLGSAFYVTVRQGSSFSFRAEGRLRDIEDLEVRVQQGRLRAYYLNNRNTRGRTRIFVTMPELDFARFSGAVDGTVSGFNQISNPISSAVGLLVEGASNLDVDLACKKLTLDLNGASRLKLQGSADAIQASISGASAVRGFGFSLNACVMDISGNSEAEWFVRQSLKGRMSGGSTVRYQGNPPWIDVDISGGSRLIRR